MNAYYFGYYTKWNMDMKDFGRGTNVWVLAARKAHLAYLNRRDTLRNKKDMQKASRWIQYNMHLATYITGFRLYCSPRVRVYQCKQL